MKKTANRVWLLFFEMKPIDVLPLPEADKDLLKAWVWCDRIVWASAAAALVVLLVWGLK